ncbi:MAG: PTS sugar transporter subunit IIA [Verrucomicrobiae bacterium]|nr:PTS sugar transporter subunit IIA [Verrucomicrobiae bacterium]MCX7915118.1 PTS sugar transporter subunit IIA [Verrucomicrobiae bacterium]MDW8345210.1 PTS sugar transporter subunit IIA [Verrucomicrobiae bacterium]
MQNVLNQLIQLQELDFALAEGRAATTKVPLAQLEQSIQRILQSLPQEVADRYRRLQKRHMLAVVPVLHGTCPPCGMTLPIALINQVRAAEQLQNCPHCGRFLYYPTTVARQPRKKLDPNQPTPVGIARFSAPSLMVPRLKAESREQAIAELAGILAKEGFVEDGQVLADLVMRREAIVSTAVEHGLAFPHARDVEGGSLTFAVGLKPKGIDFGAPDGKLTKIIFLIAIPTAASAFYLRLLAGLVKTFSETDARRQLLDCETPATMWKTLSKLTRANFM